MEYTRLLVLVLLLQSAATHAADKFIVENGTPRAEIVIAEKPARTVRLAAADLQTYVQKISGARLPIVTEPTANATKLFVGRSPHTDKLGITAEGLSCGAYRIVSGDDWLVLIGDDADFTPIEPWARNREFVTSGEMQKAWDQITGGHFGLPPVVGIDKYREKLPADLGLPAGRSEPLELWAFDERGSFNGVCGFLQRLGVRWYLPGELGEVVPEMQSIALPKIDETVRPDFDVRRFSLRFSIVPRDTLMWSMRMGMRDPYGLHVSHGMVRLTNVDDVYAAHPNWFALYGGERRYDPTHHKNQLCYSNDELFEHTVRYVRALFDHYQLDGVSVMPPDGYTAICQCPLCEGKDEPERGPRGSLSNHVWDFVNRVAKETGKTHPNKLIVCAAYGANGQPPTNIDKLEPNVQVFIVGGRRPRSGVAAQDEIRKLREGWIAKSTRPIMIFENYPLTERGWFLPMYMPRTIGESINETKGVSAGEEVWLTMDGTFEEKDLGFNHFQVYFTAQMYWGGPKKDVMLLLDEYCRLFYGPAADEINKFFEYCELNWQDLTTDKAKVDAVLALFAAAQAKVEVSSVYAKRLALIDDYLNGLRRKSAQLGQKRSRVPTVRLVGKTNGIVIDGKLDDDYWQNCPVVATGRLRELQTGRPAALGTTVKAGYSHNSVYFAIRCEERPGEKPNIGSTKNEDVAMWYGDVVEILLETDLHSYYQIAVNPAGALLDYDRGADENSWSGWSSQAEVATHVADDHWTVEIRIPVTDDENDPLNQIVGNKPSLNLPWHLNVCRQRLRANDVEHSALSPTGTKRFHEVMKFAHFYDGGPHEFETDPNATDYVSLARTAGKLRDEGKPVEALAAFRALTEGKITDLQESEALEQAAAVACRAKDYILAEELTARIPIEAVKKVSQMNTLLAQRKSPEILAQFGKEDIAAWPFWKQGDGYFARSRAHAAVGNKDEAAADVRSALEYTTDPKRRAEISKLSGGD